MPTTNADTINADLLASSRPWFCRTKARVFFEKSSKNPGWPTNLERNDPWQDPEASPFVKLVMTLLVRDADDLIVSNLDFHVRSGVDHFIVMNNLSTDRTEPLLEPYRSRGLVTYVRDERLKAALRSLRTIA